MALFSLAVASNANNGNAIGLLKGLSDLSLSLKLLLAPITPSLEVIWIRAVLDETRRGGLAVKHVPTNDGRHLFPVPCTSNHHRLSCRHVPIQLKENWLPGRTFSDFNRWPGRRRLTIPLHRAVVGFPRGRAGSRKRLRRQNGLLDATPSCLT